MNDFILVFFIFLKGCLSSVWCSDHTFFIIDGHPVNKGSLPFIVSLQRITGTHICGGSLIAPNTVLTAAHCFSGNPVKAVAGVVDLNDQLLRQERYIDKDTIRIHPSFRRDLVLYDIGLFKVRYPFHRSPSVNFITIDNVLIRSYWIEGLVAGWGITDEDDQTSLSSGLLSAELKVLSYENCYNEYGDDVRKGLICALPRYNHEDACQGDSGGPLLHNNKLIGIVSSGLECGQREVAGVYTNVSYFSHWIQENI